MDLTIPYTFYPSALPGWTAWTLFLAATAVGTGVDVVKGRGRGWLSGLYAGVLGVVGCLAASMVASMIITFFVHDL